MIEQLTEEEYSMYLSYGYADYAKVYQNWDVFVSDDTVIVDY